jgi:MtN3 and saliva related transmembrane protein
MSELALADTIGTLAGTLTTVSFLPQVVKTWRSRSTSDISLAMFVAFCTGVALWLVYGLMVGAWPVIIANFVTLILAGVILGLKIRHRHDEKGRPEGHP